MIKAYLSRLLFATLYPWFFSFLRFSWSTPVEVRPLVYPGTGLVLSWTEGTAPSVSPALPAVCPEMTGHPPTVRNGSSQETVKSARHLTVRNGLLATCFDFPLTICKYKIISIVVHVIYLVAVLTLNPGSSCTNLVSR